MKKPRLNGVLTAINQLFLWYVVPNMKNLVQMYSFLLFTHNIFILILQINKRLTIIVEMTQPYKVIMKLWGDKIPMSPGRQRFYVTSQRFFAVRAQNAVRCRADGKDSTWRHEESLPSAENVLSVLRPDIRQWWRTFRKWRKSCLHADGGLVRYFEVGTCMKNYIMPK